MTEQNNSLKAGEAAFLGAKPTQGITQETIDAIVDEALGKGIDLSKSVDVPLTEMTEEAGLNLLRELRETQNPSKLAPGAPGYAPDPEESYQDADVTEIKETLPVKLTDQDYKNLAIKMGQAGTEIAQAEDQLAAVKSQFKAKIDAAKAKSNEYASIANAGVEYRQVDCHLIKNYQSGFVRVVRMDTFETVSDRTMTSAERQRGLFEVQAPEPPVVNVVEVPEGSTVTIAPAPEGKTTE
jgi:hypothetical protein